MNLNINLEELIKYFKTKLKLRALHLIIFITIKIIQSSYEIIYYNSNVMRSFIIIMIIIWYNVKRQYNYFILIFSVTDMLTLTRVAIPHREIMTYTPSLKFLEKV